MARLLPSEAVRRAAALRVQRFAPAVQLGTAAAVGGRVLDTEEARVCVVERWGGDLCGFLNVLTRGELAHLASALNLDTAGRSSELRERLWVEGARLERGGAEDAGLVQPRPIVLGGHLVVQ